MSTHKVQTIQQRFGFADDDLHTPTHDDIVLWISREAQSIVKRHWAEQHHNTVQWSFDTTLEMPITAKTYNSKIIVGFIDVFVDASQEFWAEVNEHSYADRKRQNWGYREPNLISQRIVRSFCFEAKTTIRSFGELLRQLRLYQEYLDVRYIVVSPDDRYADALQENGIGFIKYTSPTAAK